MIIPVMIGATGIITESLKKNLEAVPGKYSIVSPQQTAILGTPHIIREVLQSEPRTRALSGDDHRSFRSTRKKRPVTIGNNNNIIIIIISLSSSLPSDGQSRNCAD